MLEGGEDGPLYQEIVDYFYSSQLRVQGKLTDKPHEIPQVVPISEVVPLLCALGYYPTQYEADLIRNEIQYSKFIETNEKTETIDFQTFLRLFLNHGNILEQKTIACVFLHTFWMLHGNQQMYTNPMYLEGKSIVGIQQHSKYQTLLYL